MFVERIKRIFFKYNKKEIINHSSYILFMAILRHISTFKFYFKCWFAGVAVGSGAKIWGVIMIRKFPGSVIDIGIKVYNVSSPSRYSFNIFPQSKLLTLSPDAKIVIGNHVGFNSINIMARSKTISIGDDTLIGGNCQIMDNDGHQLWPAEERWFNSGVASDESVNIGKNVFIGLNVIILKGVEIGNNSIIAAGSVVSNSIPANCIAAGVPAKVVQVNAENNN